MTERRGVSPAVRRRRLGAQLRRHRELAGFTIEQVAEHLGCSTSKISRLETGQIGSSPHDVSQMLTLFRVGDAELCELVEVAKETRARGWWHRQSAALTSEFVAYEQAAELIRSYEAQCVPGLLQTEEYARALLASSDAGEDQIERRLRVRMRRRWLLSQDDPVRFWCVIDEAALRRPVGGEAVMRRQVEQLGAMSDHENITLQVLPLRVGAHAGMEGSFVLLGFPHHGDTDTVFITMPTGGVFQEKPEQLSRYVWIFERLTLAALSPDDSTGFLYSLARELQ